MAQNNFSVKEKPVKNSYAKRIEVRTQRTSFARGLATSSSHTVHVVSRVRPCLPCVFSINLGVLVHLIIQYTAGAAVAGIARSCLVLGRAAGKVLHSRQYDPPITVKIIAPHPFSSSYAAVLDQFSMAFGLCAWMTLT
jgi:hypothetical protein